MHSLITRYLIAIWSLLTLSMIYSCNNDASHQTTLFNEKPVKKRYDIKSGTITYNYELLGIKGTQVVIFDDYGDKEFTDLRMEMMGTKTHSFTLTMDGKTYNWDALHKKGTKTITHPELLINYNNISDSIRTALNINKQGNEMIMGKNCTVYNLKTKETDATGKVYIWKGITLKTEMKMVGSNMTITATEIIENSNPPSSLFVVPNDVDFTEPTGPINPEIIN